MSSKEKSTMDRLTAADPASAVTEDELTRSREKSLAVMDTDAEHITVGGSVADFQQQRSRRRMRLAAGFGLVAAAAAVVAGAVLTSSMAAPPTEQSAPAATQLDPAPETGSSSGLPLPEITGSPTPTVEADIVAGSAGKLAASTTEIDGVISGGIYMRPDVLRTLKLEADNNGCIANGFLFPTGTKVTDAGLVMSDGTVFRMGDVISFGGLEVNSKDVGECADGRPLVYMEEVRAYPGKVPGIGG